MLAGVLAYLSTGAASVVAFFITLFGSGTGIVWDGTALSDSGELLLMAALFGLAFTAINFAISLIPFVGKR